jgi:hypothetical protein
MLISWLDTFKCVLNPETILLTVRQLFKRVNVQHLKRLQPRVPKTTRVFILFTAQSICFAVVGFCTITCTPCLLYKQILYLLHREKNDEGKGFGSWPVSLFYL